MQLSSAHSGKALILGDRSVSSILSAQLEAEGFVPVLQKNLSPLPRLADVNSHRLIREVLTEFVLLCDGAPERSVVHPGTTLWAERPELSSIAQELGLTVIAPSLGILSLFANKLNFLLEAERMGIPTLVQSQDPMHTVREINEHIDRGGNRFPIVLKTVKGGGSFGTLILPDAETLESDLPLGLDQLRYHLGEVILFAERYVEGSRHIVVPFARFREGTIQIFPMVDASLQSRYRKCMEFCPTRGIDAEANKKMLEWTRLLSEGCNYVGVGLFEFRVDGPQVFLIEGLARLNSSFPLWQSVAGTSAVSWQMATAQGYGKRPTCPIKKEVEWQSGLFLKIRAEDSFLQLPQPGKIQELSQKRKWQRGGASAEMSLAYTAGESVSFLDLEILGFLCVTGSSRRKVMDLAEKALTEFWIAGSLQTNERFLIELLKHPWIQEEIFHSGFVEEDFLPSVRASAEEAQLAAEICSELPRVQKCVSLPVTWFVGDPSLKWKAHPLRPVRWCEGPTFWLEQDQEGVSGIAELSQGRKMRVCVFPLQKEWLVRIGPWFLNVRRVPLRNPDQAPSSHKLFSQVQGRVHAIRFRSGAHVPAHQSLILIESSGRFIPHSLPVAARILHWNVSAEEEVSMSQELADLELLV